MIDRHIGVNQLLLDVERVLAMPPATVPVEKCLRCAKQLTRREYQILSALKRGLQGEQIALQLNLSPKTVSAHKRKAMSKLGFTRNTELYYWLQNDGLGYGIRELRSRTTSPAKPVTLTDSTTRQAYTAGVVLGRDIVTLLGERTARSTVLTGMIDAFSGQCRLTMDELSTSLAESEAVVNQDREQVSWTVQKKGDSFVTEFKK
nr:LuxR C-terminal-related transcriptional regulator [Pectobacterium carotovorum]